MKNNIFYKLSAFIVKFRFIFLGLFLAMTVLGGIGLNFTKVNYDITSYLPADSETRKALDIMEKEFAEAATTDVMVKNISVEKSNELADLLRSLAAVSAVDYDSSSSSYYNSDLQSALYTITMVEAIESPKTAINEIREVLKDYDIALRGSAASDVLFSEMMQKQMMIILAIAIVVILTILTLTSKSFFEIPIFLVVFGVAALLNMGSNFLFGSISFVTNSIAIVLQLALAIDYAIILAHRFADELKTGIDPRQAVVQALAKSMPSILASAATTISGLIAIMFMQFRIGLDIGMVLTKGIVFSFLTVFFLMPCLLLVSAKLISKTAHRNFVPSVEKPFAKVMKARKAIPLVGLALIIGGCVAQSFTHFGYDTASYPTSKMTTYSKNVKAIEDAFGKQDLLFGIIVDRGDYTAEKRITEEALTTYPEVLKNGFSLGYLTDGIDPYTPVTVAETHTIMTSIGTKFGVDIKEIKESTLTLLFKTYNLEINQKFTADPVYLFDQVDGTKGFLTFATENLSAVVPGLDNILISLTDYLNLLVSSAHSRIIFTIDAERYTAESPEVFAMIRELRKSLNDDSNLTYKNIYLFGDNVSYFDISESFTADRLMVSLLTVFCIFIILLISFRSLSLPVILLLTIQGAIWINFGIYALSGTPLLFLSYLLVSAIHMGATIDYAIVITNRYSEYRREGIDRQTAGVKAISSTFTTILTSSSIMTIAGFIIAGISTEPYIFTVGMTLGSGTLISLVMVLFFLPAMLVSLDKIVEKTTWHGKKKN